MKRRSAILSALALVLTLAVVMQGVMPVNAAPSEVQIEVKATDMNLAVTIPSQIPIVFNEDGTNTYPTDWKIKNESTIAGIYLSQVHITGDSDGWMLLGSSVDTKELPANTKKVKFFMGKSGALKPITPPGPDESIVGMYEFDKQHIPVAAGEEAQIEFKVDRGAFTEASDMEKAFDVTLTFEFM